MKDIYIWEDLFVLLLDSFRKLTYVAYESTFRSAFGKHLRTVWCTQRLLHAASHLVYNLLYFYLLCIH
jgi:hypothetical protein